MTNIIDFLLKKQTYMTIISLFIYILIGYIAYKIIKRFLLKEMTKGSKKRKKTITKLIISSAKIVIVIIEIILILQLFGIDVTSLLAGLGIASVVLGLALQDIMKDILSGVFIVLEDQFDIGDMVEINNLTGTVDSIGVKSTKLHTFDGKTIIIPNRNIGEIINYSKRNMFAVVDIPIPYEEDLNKAEKAINKVAEIIEKELPNVIGKVEILGINELASSSINYRIMVETKGLGNFVIQRQIKKIVLEEFNKENISIPYNKVEVINGK